MRTTHWKSGNTTYFDSLIIYMVMLNWRLRQANGSSWVFVLLTLFKSNSIWCRLSIHIMQEDEVNLNFHGIYRPHFNCKWTKQTRTKACFLYRERVSNCILWFIFSLIIIVDLFMHLKTSLGITISWREIFTDVVGICELAVML